MPDYGERYNGNGDGYTEYGGASPPPKSTGFDDFGDSRSQVYLASRPSIS